LCDKSESVHIIVIYIILFFFFSSPLRGEEKKKENKKNVEYWPMIVGQVIGVIIWAVLSTKIPNLGGMQAGKKRKFLQRRQLVVGSQRRVWAEGGRDGGGGVWLVVVGCLVHS